VYAVLSDLSRVNDWSPYYRADPGAVCTVSEPSTGVGARYTWEGKRSGHGSMEIVACEPDACVTLSLVFHAPFPGTHTTTWACQPDGPGGSRVTWTMAGERPTWMWVLSPFLDRMLSRQFDDGLAALAELLERRGRASA
jgi:hypothetical protein